MSRQVYGIGETVLDIIFKSGQAKAAKAGGSSLNAIITLGRLNFNVCFISEMGDDKVGDMIKRFLQDNGVHTEYINRFKTGKSAISLAFLNEQNDATYEFFKDYPNQRLQVKVPDFSFEDIVLFGSYYGINKVLRPQMKKIIGKAKKEKTCVVYDPNFRSSHVHEVDELKETLFENFSYADILRGSDEDFFNILGETDPFAVYDQLKNISPVLVITANKKGIYLFTPSFNKYYHVTPIETVSTIGAGDNFNAGLVYGLLKHHIYQKDIVYLKSDIWDDIISDCIAFSTDVCMHLDNYISHETAVKYALKH